MPKWYVDRGGNATVPIWDYPKGQKKTVANNAQTFTVYIGQEYVRLTNTGGGTVYYRADGIAATNAGAGTIPVAAGQFDELAVDGGLSVYGVSGDVFVVPIKR